MRSTLFILILLGLSSLSFGQTKLDFGEIKADSAFNRTDRYLRQIFMDSTYWKVGNILDSKTEFEIRLHATYMSSSEVSELFIITYNSGIWNAEKFWYEINGPFGKISSTKIGLLNSQEQKVYDQVFKYTFDELKKDSIFLLPEQSDLQFNDVGRSAGGAVYSITFKVGNKFGHYQFIDNKRLLEMNPEIRELIQYHEIVYTIKALFH